MGRDSWVGDSALWRLGRKGLVNMIFFAAKPKYYDIRGGEGVPVRKIGRRHHLFGNKRVKFKTPSWEVLVSDKVYIGAGYVNGMEPQLNGEPIGGVYADGTNVSDRPGLDLPKEGVKAVLLKITPTQTLAGGNLFGEETEDLKRGLLADAGCLQVYMGDLSEAATHNSKSWIHPLALVSSGGKLAQLCVFDIEYYATRRLLFEDLLGLVHYVSAYPGIPDYLLRRIHERTAEDIKKLSEE